MCQLLVKAEKNRAVDKTGEAPALLGLSGVKIKTFNEHRKNKRNFNSKNFCDVLGSKVKSRRMNE